MISRRIRFGLSLALIYFALPLGCAPALAPVQESTLERAKREGRIRIGYANENPFAYLDSASNTLTGEAPEVLRAVMRRLGVSEVDGVLTEFGSLIPGLRAGRFDIIAAGMYITPERCDQIAFSNPSYQIGEALIVKQGNPLALHSFEDVAAHKTATIGVMGGAVEHGYARKSGIPDHRIVVFPDNISGLDGIRAGRIDAFAATSLTAQSLLAKSNDARAEQAEPFTNPVIDGKAVYGYGAFGLRKEDTALKAAIDSELAEFIGTEEHLALVAPFGFTESNIPRDISAIELCER